VPLALSYDLQPPDERTGLPARRCLVLSCNTGHGILLGDTKPPGLDICGAADRLGTCVIEFHKGRVAFTGICSP
jgi:hypothetical protein